MYAGSPTARRYCYAELTRWLLDAHIDFDFADEEMLGRLATVEDAGSLRVGQAVYRTVVIGHMTTMRPSTLSILQEFAEAGGRMIFVGEPPVHVDAVRSDEPCVLAASTVHVDWNKTRFVDAHVSLNNGLSSRSPTPQPENQSRKFSVRHDWWTVPQLLRFSILLAAGLTPT